MSSKLTFTEGPGPDLTEHLAQLAKRRLEPVHFIIDPVRSSEERRWWVVVSRPRPKAPKAAGAKGRGRAGHPRYNPHRTGGR